MFPSLHCRPAVFLVAFIVSLAAWRAVPALAGELLVSADTPTVRVSTRPASKRFINLPALEYRFRIDAACSAEAVAETLSLSIADTRVSLSSDRLAETDAAELSVTIPATQIPPVTIEGFCIDDAASADGSVRIPSVLSAQASLLCVADSGRRMTYASAPLDVLVHCQRTEQPSPETE